MKSLAFALIILSVTSAFAGGGDYFSGPGRSPSYGPEAKKAGFSHEATTSSQPQNLEKKS